MERTDKCYFAMSSIHIHCIYFVYVVNNKNPSLINMLLRYVFILPLNCLVFGKNEISKFHFFGGGVLLNSCPLFNALFSVNGTLCDFYINFFFYLGGRCMLIVFLCCSALSLKSDFVSKFFISNAW